MMGFFLVIIDGGLLSVGNVLGQFEAIYGLARPRFSVEIGPDERELVRVHLAPLREKGAAYLVA